MTAHPDVKKRSLKQILGGWFYSIVTRPGWPRWATLAVAAFLFMLSALYLTRSTDYREEPSALVPRSADVYAETRDLSGLLKTVGAWRVWHPDRRGSGQEARTELEKDLAGLISAHVGGLPINPPLRWMSASLGAGWCVSRNETGPESWALYLRLDDPAAALKEVEVEPGMTLEVLAGARTGDGVFSLAGKDGGIVYFGIVGPWLIVSGDEKLPTFALEAKRRPSQSLGGSGIVPKWRRSASVRGVFHPGYAMAQGRSFGPSFVTNWLSPDARVTYTAILGRSGGVETYSNTVELTDRTGAGGWWPLFLIIMGILAIVSLGVIFTILLVMVGWGGWFKALAIKAGIAPAGTPARVEPSRAFKQDSGIIDAEKDEKTENTAKLSDVSKAHDESAVSDAGAAAEAEASSSQLQESGNVGEIVTGDTNSEASESGDETASGAESTQFESGINKADSEYSPKQENQD